MIRVDVQPCQLVEILKSVFKYLLYTAGTTTDQQLPVISRNSSFRSFSRSALFISLALVVWTHLKYLSTIDNKNITCSFMDPFAKKQNLYSQFNCLHCWQNYHITYNIFGHKKGVNSDNMREIYACFMMLPP